MNKINSAESLRGLACLAVVFSHLSLTFFPQLHNFENSNLPKFKIFDWIHNSPFGFFYSGTGAVFVFFVLSGYVLSLTMMNSKDIKLKLKKSFLKRYPRLAIPAIISCILFWGLFHFNVNLSLVSEWFFNTGNFKLNFFDAIYSGSVDAFLFGRSEYNGVLWTMQIELFGSFLIYLLCYLYKNKTLIFTFLFLAFSLFVSFFVSKIFFLGILSFVFGMLIQLYIRSLPDLLGVFFLLFGLYLCGAHNDSFSYLFFSKVLNSNTYTALNFIGGLFVTLSVLRTNIILRVLDKRILIYLGKISFSIYLIHIIIIYAFGVPSFNFFVNYFEFIYAALLASIIVFLLTLFFAVFYSKYVDDFSIKISNKIIS